VKPLFILRETGFKNQYSVVKRDYKIFVETIFIEVVYRVKRNTNEPCTDSLSIAPTEMRKLYNFYAVNDTR
jgi:hypothetical protein